MKLKFDDKKIKEFLLRNKSRFIYVGIALFVLLISYVVFMIVTITEDSAVVAENQSKFKSLNISFDKKYLEELKNKKSPSIINENGGRNPFFPFSR